MGLLVISNICILLFLFQKSACHLQGSCLQYSLKLLMEPSWSWSFGSWIYNYLCNQCISPL